MASTYKVSEAVSLLIANLSEDKTPLCWPPESFAVAAYLLHHSGWYTKVIEKWPKAPHHNHDEWITYARALAANWRASFANPNLLPEIDRLWQIVFDNGDTPLLSTEPPEDLVVALVQIMTIADQASKTVGIGALQDDFDETARGLLSLQKDGVSMCSHIDPCKLRVLPKLHTPQNGMTIRSLSHHLALTLSSEVRPKWVILDDVSERHSLNLLVLPFPLEIAPVQFREAEFEDAPRQGFSYFTFEAPPSEPENEIVGILLDTYNQAKKKMGVIDGIVLPELALNEAQLNSLRTQLLQEDTFIVCGTVTPSQGNSPGKNEVTFSVPYKDTESDEHQGWVTYAQSKHHRWQLDKGQILQYGLGSRLDPAMKWWEYIPLGGRDLYFLTIRDWLTICVLICEDLSRQDPIAEVVRSVGPNLVVALLMDGPQVPGRWPGRYAMVLADDPGSSVLTMTSKGMVELSSPPPGTKRSNSVALWKDAAGGSPRDIELAPGSKGIVLTLTRQKTEEFTADGRSDDASAAHIILSGIHHV